MATSLSLPALLPCCYLSSAVEEANFLFATPPCLLQEEELHPILETLPHEASGDYGESGISWVSGASGLPEVSGDPWASGVPEVSGESGASGVPEDSGEPLASGVPEESGESGLHEVSGEPGASGIPEVSGETGASGVPDVSGEPGISGVLVVSGGPGISGVPEVFKKLEPIELFEESGIPELETGEPVISLESGESGVTEAPDVTIEISIPDLYEGQYNDINTLHFYGLDLWIWKYDSC